MTTRPSDLRATKAMLRRTQRAWRAAQSIEEVAVASLRVCDRVAALPQWGAARVVLFYSALPGEVDLTSLLTRAGRRTVAFPVVVGKGRPLVARTGGMMRLGPYGIQEPDASSPVVPLDQIDLVLVPGLAFDRAGGRLGQGGGFYDRTLARSSAVRVAVAFDPQLIEAVPVGPYDERMDLVVTDRQTVQLRSLTGRM